MKFYLEQIQAQEGSEAKALFEYNSINEAEAAYHSTMASSILSDNILFVRCRVINQYGMENMKDFWQAPSVELPDRYYLSQVQYKDEGEDVKALFDYATVDEAVSAWHSMLAATMGDVQFSAALGIVEDRYGNEVKNEYWQRAEDQP